MQWVGHGLQGVAESHTGRSAIGDGSASFHSGHVTAGVAAEVQVHGHLAVPVYQ